MPGCSCCATFVSGRVGIKQPMASTSNTDELIARLNGETAKIGWHQLQQHYATGNVLAVAAGSDLIKVAIAMHRDDTARIQRWLADGSLMKISDHQAKTWYQHNSTVWALVIPPFVLVQEQKQVESEP